jgi:hypothetical protein
MAAPGVSVLARCTGLPGSESRASAQGFFRNLGDPVVSFREKYRYGEPGDQAPGLYGATRSTAEERSCLCRKVLSSRRITKRGKMGGRKSEHPRGTEEVGEPAPGDPVEGRGMSGYGIV